MNDIARNCAERRAAEAANDIDRLLAGNARLADKALRFEKAANELRDSHLSALDVIQQGIAREDAMCSKIERLTDEAKRCDLAHKDLTINHLNALETISNGIAREDAMRTEIALLGDKLCAAAKTIAELNERIVSANLLDRARRTGVPA
jgi:hypothetical protein